MKSRTRPERTMKSVTIIVPVKDEEVGLQYLLEDYNGSSLRVDHDVKFIFVIDHRSSDSSQKYASELSDIIINQKETTGKGAAIKQAVEFWKSDTTEFIIFLDAGNKFLSKASSIRNRRNISDLCTGLWGFSEKALKKLDIQSNGFDLEAEIAGLARKNGFKHHEVEVEWGQRKGGTSKLRSLTDGLIIFFRIIRT